MYLFKRKKAMGFSLLEVSLALGIAAVLVSGIFIAYKQVNTSANVATIITSLSPALASVPQTADAAIGMPMGAASGSLKTALALEFKEVDPRIQLDESSITITATEDAKKTTQIGSITSIVFQLNLLGGGGDTKKKLAQKLALYIVKQSPEWADTAAAGGANEVHVSFKPKP